MTDPSPLSEQDQADLTSYLDGELDAASARALEARLHLDPQVRAEADSLRRTWELLDYLPRPEPSPSFTYRTLDRVSAMRPASQGTGRRSWAVGLCWAAAAVLLWSIGFGLVVAWSRFNRPQQRPALAQEDTSLLHALDRPDLFGDEGIEPSGMPGGLGELIVLSTEDQQRFRRFERELANEDAATRAHLLCVLERYLKWLEHLPEDQRQALETANADDRLRLVTEARDKEWLTRQPLAIREKVEKATGDERVNLLAGLRLKENKLRQEWLRTSQASPAPIVRAQDLPREIQNYLDLLRPLLSLRDRERLEGQGAQGPLDLNVLRDLSEAYGYAIPGSASPVKPRNIKDVPLLEAHFNRRREAQLEKQLHRNLTQAAGKWPDFGIEVMKAASKLNISLPSQPWAPCRKDQFASSFRQFLERKLLSTLTEEEAERLHGAEGKWPDYPRVVADLARKKDLSVPGISLPGAPAFWRRLSSLPEVPDQSLVSYLETEMTADERAGLQLSFTDPSSRERLKEEYFRRYPERLQRLLQADYQNQLRKAELTAKRS